MKLAPTLALLVLSSLTALATAGEIKPFSQHAFDTLTQAGKPVLLDISASWCPTCKAQKPIIAALMKQPAYQAVTLLTIDFDSNKPTLNSFKVTMQSTLIAFKGQREVGRSVGDTTASGLEALIKKTVH